MTSRGDSLKRSTSFLHSQYILPTVETTSCAGDYRYFLRSSSKLMPPIVSITCILLRILLVSCSLGLLALSSGTLSRMALTFWQTCTASSRVGTSTTAWVLAQRALSCPILCRNMVKQARVLPVPDLDRQTRFMPGLSRHSLREWYWMGVGVAQRLACRSRQMKGSTPAYANVWAQWIYLFIPYIQYSIINACDPTYDYIVKDLPKFTPMSSLLQDFERSISDDIPAVKLLKFKQLISRHKQQAAEHKDRFLRLALDNRLLGEYENIFVLLAGNVNSALDKQKLELKQAFNIQVNEMYSRQKMYKVEGNIARLAQVQLELGLFNFNNGFYEEAAKELNELYVLNQNQHGVKFEEYATELALSQYYINNYGSFVRFNARVIEKSLLKRLPEVCIVKDLNNFVNKKFLDQPFRNVFENEVNSLDIATNRLMKYEDIGFMYSIMAIAYKQKQDISFVKWSCKLENKYVNNQYKQVLETLEKERSARCFLPALNLVYDTCAKLIQKKILVEMVASFERCPFQEIKRVTGISEGRARLIMRENYAEPIYEDQITQSLLYRKNSTLPREVDRLYQILRRQFEQKAQSYAMSSGAESILSGYGIHSHLM